MLNERISGVLLHVTSLPSHGGVGDFGPAARRFVDFLAAGKQKLWQVLPLSPTGYGSSPYSALSAFAGNPLLISLELLAEDGWIAWDKLHGLAGDTGNCDFERASREKLPLVEEAAANFLDRADEGQKAKFAAFCDANAGWLRDWAMFWVLRRANGHCSWHEWPADQAHRTDEALAALLRDHGRELAIEQVVQFFFAEQWAALRIYCKEHDVRILGDVAIFVNYDSADVWTHPDLFELDAELKPLRVSGVPPDYFSATGQRWGNPLYRWDVLEKQGFDWWIARIGRTLALFDMIRLDHFRGFVAYWSIEASEPTAVNGRWVQAPGEALLTRLKAVFGELPFVAEDLGVITRDVDALRESFGMPGMRVLQFGFSDRGAHLHLPHMYTRNTVAYTGTHDNNTTLGWWRDNTSEEEKKNFQGYLHTLASDGEVDWTAIRAVAGSVADVAIYPLQDILHVGSDGRMNMPSASKGNWCWRYWPEALHPDFAAKMAWLMELTDRDGYVVPEVVLE